ncbi:MAG: hypothetical protein LHW64_01610 [Candidatus Cloacimonetes bacterium]|nr:hypothetical protein [Candidatus Cloacimonadota bacterium]MCB5286482.1 hypothetical protein [Candidatus Cloacimonadota bacterium]MCK9183768.1 hypothetical protein [Candidatus Cloacimonadota bacterium]MCK9583476.1 hypothetical protein [Candidatus Cloacimonadota bacterium]MDY0228804.1 hypothetical protein [Candidatus Cloacimonadaceae bacterium]
MISIMNTFGVWLAAFFTLCIFSFLYQDNPFYKFAEQVFVGLSAAYWLVYIIYSIMVPNLFAKLAADFSGNIILLIPAALGLMMLMRIHPKTQWISRYPIAIMVGTTAGISMLRYMKSDILQQLTATMINPFAADTTPEVIGNLLMIIGTICGVYFFYFSKKQEGVSKAVSKVGIWFLMVSFGATFGYTVMARISLLIGRLDFLLGDWLHLIK